MNTRIKKKDIKQLVTPEMDAFYNNMEFNANDFIIESNVNSIRYWLSYNRNNFAIATHGNGLIICDSKYLPGIVEELKAICEEYLAKER